MKKFIVTGVLLALFALPFAGCDTGGSGGDHASEGLKDEHNIQETIENNYAKDQPVPVLTNSQVRENLIEIKEAIAEGVETTSFFFNFGMEDPIKSCPSIGSPIPASAQLTNPEQVIEKGEHDNGSVVVPQMDPDGIYQGNTEGTYVLCIEAKGKPYVSYWEGSVMTEFAPATWDYDNHRVELLGSSSWEFSKHTPTSVTK
jgi:hypothetical protein